MLAFGVLISMAVFPGLLSPGLSPVQAAAAAPDNADRKRTKANKKKAARKESEKPEKTVQALPRLRGTVPKVEKAAGAAPTARDADKKADKAEDEAKTAAQRAAERKELLKGADIAAPPELLGTALLRRLAGAFQRATKAPLRFQALNPDTLNDRLKGGQLHAALLSKGANDRDPAGAAMAAFQPVFYVDLYIVGPAKDPADIKGMVSLPDAMRAVARSRSAFLASPAGHGLNRLEQRVWKEAGVQPVAGRDDWYLPSAIGPAHSTRNMLIRASLKRAYMIVDRATWLASDLARGKKKQSLRILVRDDPRLQLVYGVTIRRNGEAAPVAGRRFRQWLTGKAAAQVINNTRIGDATPYLAERGLRR